MDKLDLLDQITHETMSLSNLDNMNSLSDNMRDLQMEVLNDKIPSETGVLFFINKGKGTFKIEFLACENMLESYFNFKDSLNEKFNSKKDEIDISIQSFSCKSMETAEIIVTTLSKRRFPLEEEQMANISDPGFSWWFKFKDQKLDLSFSLQQNSSASWMNLGLLADDILANKIISNIDWDLLGASFMTLKNGFSISFTDNIEVFSNLKSMFLYGDESILKDLKPSFKVKSDQFFLKEIIELRKFWIRVHMLLSKNSLLKSGLLSEEFFH